MQDRNTIGLGNNPGNNLVTDHANVAHSDNNIVGFTTTRVSSSQ